MDFHVFSLLRLDENQQNATNLSGAGFREQIAVYVDNAILLSKTLAIQGVDFTLLTNDKSLIEKVVNDRGHQHTLNVLEIPFHTEVPSGIRFYSSHYKLDAFRYLASAESGYLALCDLDMICANPVPASLKHLVEARVPMFYDITDQVTPAYGQDRIIRDLSSITGLASEGRWSGGEFIGGPPEFFRALVDAIEDVYANYVARIPSLHHVGDEAFTSSALEMLRRRGSYVADAGTLGIVGRYWNTAVLHPQRPFAFFDQCFLLHLPSDKKFLARIAGRDPEALSDVKSLYARHRRSFPVRLKKGVRSGLRFLRSLARQTRRATLSPSSPEARAEHGA